jgi:hypothetical protein
MNPHVHRGMTNTVLPVCRPLQIETFRNLSPFSMAKNPGNWLFMLRFRRKSLFSG